MVQEYSKPQNTAASRYTTPGPRYKLPTLLGEKNHDTSSGFLKNPAYSFGVRHGKSKDNKSPGPCYFPNPKILRDGYQDSPQFSIYGRQKTFKEKVNPGPGGHPSEKAISACYPNYPAFSFGIRNPYRPVSKTPASNCYGLNHITVLSSKFQAPSYSLGGLVNLEKVTVAASKLPGPGTYSGTNPNIYKDMAPLFSVTGRNLMPGHSCKTPGPAAHMVNKTPIQHSNPAYSFGVRHSDYKTHLIVDIPNNECDPIN